MQGKVRRVRAKVSQGEEEEETACAKEREETKAAPLVFYAPEPLGFTGAANTSLLLRPDKHRWHLKKKRLARASIGEI